MLDLTHGLDQECEVLTGKHELMKGFRSGFN